jgi:hypothetical protein
MCYRNMQEQWKCFKVYNFRLVYDTQLVHLLVCDTQWIFKMRGATLKIMFFLYLWFLCTFYSETCALKSVFCLFVCTGLTVTVKKLHHSIRYLVATSEQKVWGSVIKSVFCNKRAVWFCLSVFCLSIYLSISPSIYLVICPSIFLSILQWLWVCI